MRDLKVETWEQWERLNCLMLAELVRRWKGVTVAYESYGGQGQKQDGVDLVPVSSPLPEIAATVGQSKLRDKTAFTWTHVEVELKKTDAYPHPIKHYVIFTTAAKHVSIQNKFMDGPYYHTRPGGSKFKVFVKYWDDYQGNDLDFIPHQVRSDIFSSAARLLTPDAPVPVVGQDLMSSLAELRAFIPTVFPIDLVEWLESWEYERGFVGSAEYDVLVDLYLEIARAVSGSRDLMFVGDRYRLARCLPAGDELFAVLEEFYNQVNDVTASGSLQNGTKVQRIEGIPTNDWPKITNGWRRAGHALAYVYRRTVLGQGVE
ncbi:TPA: hypothetical protein ACP32N_003297 [Pseudomonas aeruginosa]